VKDFVLRPLIILRALVLGTVIHLRTSVNLIQKNNLVVELVVHVGTLVNSMYVNDFVV